MIGIEILSASKVLAPGDWQKARADCSRLAFYQGGSNQSSSVRSKSSFWPSDLRLTRAANSLYEISANA
ncbi:hypothetical protein G6N73_12395 [Mesorhizobium camelthorni]|uniref:Uncharacterized protein n=1 Tax=Allomesorhizobium camelthorni TaxID=475069 RepID=A0A6G4WB33_9HYPH|nr:hypothetical protein [Mesorhizobium camelthorni]